MASTSGVSMLALLMVLVPTVADAGVSTPLLTDKRKSCKVTVLHDAVKGRPGVLVIRAVSDSGMCKVNQKWLLGLLDRSLAILRPRNDLVQIKSVFVGRIIRYPWISTELKSVAGSSKAWNNRKQKSRSGSVNKFVNQLLSSSRSMKSIYSVLDKHGYKPSGTSCEKVLIGKDKLPFDAICWIKLTLIR